MTETLTGGCLCGAVRYEISAEPMIALKCHCLVCRKISGAGHSPLAAFPANAVKIEGELKGFQGKADSGAETTSEFCPTCGAPVFGRNNRMPDMVAVRIGSLDDPNKVTPSLEIYTKRTPDWDKMDDQLPAFPEMPPMG